MSKNIIECDNLYKIYKEDEIEVFALQGIDLTVAQGEFLAIIGSSGSGKSTLLNILGGLDKPSTGKLFIDGIDMFKLTERQMREYKRDKVGFVWQNNARNLLGHLSALENIEVVLGFSKGSKKDKNRGLDLLERVEMSHRRNSKLSELSGGEQQRVAIAIALANNPKILLADEPTGSVDSKTSSSIFKLFNDLNKALKLTIIVVTHDMQVAHKVNRVVAISDGKISKELISKALYDNDCINKEELFTDISSGDTHEEYLVLDRYGRVQLPLQFLEIMKASNKVRAKMVDGNIIIHT
ncbi:ABC transporter ATP-binding protein [Candidatus Clostridium stratigraminis]|uniref:ABC transporter ATP-binding protein n=1 Tax=Candidatus Clostridium stratigraminis TaxID=3381661 RepID=A0ABW8T6L5_9CLOT